MRCDTSVTGERDTVLDVLGRLDRLLAARLAGESASDPLALGDEPHVAWLRETFGLTPREIDFVLVALAPEVDGRYRRIFAELQGEHGARRPSVDLVLSLLTSGLGERLEARRAFAVDGRLVGGRLVHLVPPPGQPDASLLDHALRLDEQIVSVLLGDGGLDPRLDSFCRIVEPAGAAVDDSPLAALVRESRARRRPLRLHLTGPRDSVRTELAMRLAEAAGAPLLVADMGRAPRDAAWFAGAMPVLHREALLHDAVLLLDRLDELDALRAEILLDGLDHAHGVVLAAGDGRFESSEGRGGLFVEIPVPAPDHVERRRRWGVELAWHGVTVGDGDLEALAGRFALTGDEIAAAASAAVVRSRIDGRVAPSAADLLTTARDQGRRDLAGLAARLDPTASWEDLVAPAEVTDQLRELCARVAAGPRVLGEWGFRRRMALGRGVSALFAGPSGTGKTMAAQVVAAALGLDLYRIDLAAVVSKYIGETEKNLGRVFAVAERANAILFFDEADALFGKRSEVRDAHDRYANLEVAYLLQRMESYDGVAILATNLRDHLDDAFARRLAFAIHFPFPDVEARRRIWSLAWPPETPLDGDLNIEFLAERLVLSGGGIRNVAVAAAFLAAEAGEPVGMPHLVHAARREYQKLGRALETESADATRGGGS